jgi:hypothetical protein
MLSNYKSKARIGVIVLEKFKMVYNLFNSACAVPAISCSLTFLKSPDIKVSTKWSACTFNYYRELTEIKILPLVQGPVV